MKLHSRINNDITEINQIRTGANVTVFKQGGGTVTLPTATYLEKRAAWLTLIEGYANSVYFDHLGLKTIGIGHYMGNPNGDSNEQGAATASQNNFLAALNINITEWQRVFNGQRILTDTEVTNLFNYDAASRQLRLENKLAANNVVWSTLTTQQQTALFGLFYNNEGLVGNKLISAIASNDAIKAMKEIVQESNAQNDLALAHRRLKDWSMFNNQDAATVTMPDSTFWKLIAGQRVLGTATITVEGPYPSFIRPAKPTSELGNPGTRDWTVWDAYEKGNGAITITNMDATKGKYLMGGKTSGVLSFTSNRRADIDEIGSEDNVIFSGDVGDQMIGASNATTVFYCNDGDDTAIGGERDDHIVLGKGKDRGEGGNGYDTYYGAYNEGKKTISDSDGQGEIQFNAQAVKGAIIPATNQPGQYYHEREDATFIFTRTTNEAADQNGADLTMTVDKALDGNTPDSTTVEDFNYQNGTLGLEIAKPTAATSQDVSIGCEPSEIEFTFPAYQCTINGTATGHGTLDTGQLPLPQGLHAFIIRPGNHSAVIGRGLGNIAAFGKGTFIGGGTLEVDNQEAFDYVKGLGRRAFGTIGSSYYHIFGPSYVSLNGGERYPLHNEIEIVYNSQRNAVDFDGYPDIHSWNDLQFLRYRDIDKVGTVIALPNGDRILFTGAELDTVQSGEFYFHTGLYPTDLALPTPDHYLDDNTGKRVAVTKPDSYYNGLGGKDVMEVDIAQKGAPTTVRGGADEDSFTVVMPSGGTFARRDAVTQEAPRLRHTKNNVKREKPSPREREKFQRTMREFETIVQEAQAA